MKMIDSVDIENLRSLHCESVAMRLGFVVKQHKSLCCFHDDHEPSMTYKGSHFRCWSCGAHGDTLDLVMRYLKKNFLDACRWLADEHNVILTEYKPKEEKPAKPFDASRYERFFERPWLSAEARRFLFEERRLDPRVVRWCRLTSWKDRQGTPWLQIPYYSREGRLVGVQNRNLSLPQLGEVGGGFTFHMYPDRDAPGERLFLQLKEVLPHLVHHQLPPGCKDFGEYYKTSITKKTP